MKSNRGWVKWVQTNKKNIVSDVISDWTGILR